MTSKRSFINIMKEDMKLRLWPLALATVGFFFALPVPALIKLEDRIDMAGALEFMQYDFAKNILGPTNFLVIFGLVIMAVISSMQGMKYLHNKGETDFYGSIPVLRSSKFAAAYVNGILITLVPYLVMQLVAAILGAAKGSLTPAGYLYGLKTAFILMCSYLLIYTIIVLAAILTGHGAVTVCASFVLLFGLEIYAMLAEGFSTNFWVTKYSTEDPTFLMYLCPFTLLTFSLDELDPIPYAYDYLPWSYRAAYGILLTALLLFGLCMYLIKKRPAESAGRAMAFAGTKPIIKVLIMIPVSLTFGIMFSSISEHGAYRWLAFGIIIGLILSHAVVEIIYEFDFKACAKHLRSALIAAVITAIIVCIFVFDPFGYDSRLPKEDQIQSAAVYVEGLDNGPYTRSYRWDLETLSESDRILKEMDLNDTGSAYALAKAGRDNAALYRMKDGGPIMGSLVSFDLKLKSGKDFKRSYYLDLSDPELYGIFEKLYNTEEYKNAAYYALSEDRLPDLKDITYFTYETADNAKIISDLDERQKQVLIDAISADIRSLTLDDLKADAPVGRLSANVEFKSVQGNPDSGELELGYVYPSFERTLSLLSDFGADTHNVLRADQIRSIEVSSWDEEAFDEMTLDVIVDPEEIEKLVPDLVLDYYSTVNQAVFGVDRDQTYTVSFKDRNRADEVYVKRAP